MSDIRKKLQEDIANINWQEIIPHARRDAVIIIDRQLNLIEVAEAIALNQTTIVSHWIAEKLIAKPTQQQLTDWNSKPETEFTTAIVQPFVIIQALD